MAIGTDEWRNAFEATSLQITRLESLCHTLGVLIVNHPRLGDDNPCSVAIDTLQRIMQEQVAAMAKAHGAEWAALAGRSDLADSETDRGN